MPGVRVPSPDATNRFEQAQADAERLILQSPHLANQPELPLPYQYVGIANFMERMADEGGSTRMGIFDPMGLGKTKQGSGSLLAMDAAATMRIQGFQTPFPAVVVCPRAVIPAWVREFSRIARGLDICIPEGIRDTDDGANVVRPRAFLPSLGNVIQQPTRPSVLIYNYEALTNTQVRQAISGLAPNFFGLVIVDEVHKINTINTDRYDSIINLIERSRSALVMSGTPLLSTVFDAWPVFRILQRDVRQPNKWNTRFTAENARESQQMPNNPSPWLWGPGGEAEGHSQGQALPWAQAPNRAYATFSTRAGRNDIVDPVDGFLLAPLLQEAGVRRSRRGVFESNTVDERFLQPRKVRDFYVIPRPNQTMTGDQQTAWTNYLTESDRGIQELLGRNPRQDPSTLSLLNLDSAVQQLENAYLTFRRSNPGLDRPTFMQRANALPSVQTARNALIQAARRAYVVQPQVDASGNAIDIEGQSLNLMERYVTNFQNDFASSDLVFFTPRVDDAAAVQPAGALAQTAQVVRRLAGALSQRGRVVYVFTGQYKAVFQNAMEIRDNLTAEELENAFSLIPQNRSEAIRWSNRSGRQVIDEEAEDGQTRFVAAPVTAIISKAAEVGIGLPSADHLAMLGRLSSPFREDQVEDRINRAGRGADRPAMIHYFLVDDFFGYAEAARIENRRMAAMAAMGERPGDDRANPLTIDVGPNIQAMIQNRTLNQLNQLDQQRLFMLGLFRVVQNVPAALNAIARLAFNDQRFSLGVPNQNTVLLNQQRTTIIENAIISTLQSRTRNANGVFEANIATLQNSLFFRLVTGNATVQPNAAFQNVTQAQFDTLFDAALVNLETPAANQLYGRIRRTNRRTTIECPDNRSSSSTCR
jgi:hypothetical protein